MTRLLSAAGSTSKPAGRLARRALLLAAVLLPGAGPAVLAQTPYRNPALAIEARVLDLLGRMTLEEKFWQLFMSPGSLDDPSHDYSDGAFGLQIGVDSASARPAVRVLEALIAGSVAEMGRRYPSTGDA